LFAQEGVINEIIEDNSNTRQYIQAIVNWVCDDKNAEAMKLLLTEEVLQKLRAKPDNREFYSIENNLKELQKCDKKEIKDIAIKGLETINQIKYQAALQDLSKLNPETSVDLNKANVLLLEARESVTTKNVNKTFKNSYSLLVCAAHFGNVDTIKCLLSDSELFDTLKKMPMQLADAIKIADIYYQNRAFKLLIKQSGILGTIIDAAKKGEVNPLKLCVESKITLKKIMYISPKGFKDIESALNNLSKSKSKSPEVRTFTTEALKTIREIKNERNRNAAKAAIVTGVLTGVTINIVGGTFVGALLAMKVQNLFKDTRLVFNYLLPLLNKINNLLMKISPKLDLNNLAKTPGLMIGIIAAFIAIGSALVEGAKAYNQQDDIFRTKFLAVKSALSD
jgi:hypothetical protein